MRDRLLLKLPDSAATQLAEFVDIASGRDKFASYKVFPQKNYEIIENIHTHDGDLRVRIFLRAAIVHQLLCSLTSPAFTCLPQRVREQQLKQFSRIVSEDNTTAPWLDINIDLFQKEFGIAALRLYVAGSQLVDPYCGIPRSILTRGRPLDWIRSSVAVGMLGGFRPYFEIHTHQFMLDTFNEEGWNECYRCCAELYELHPEIIGMYGSSWFYDPALGNISPRLDYLRAVPQAGGAYLLYVESGGNAILNSTSTSPTRKQLYEQGKYMPRNYMIVWGKTRQQAWARSSSDSRSLSI